MKGELLFLGTGGSVGVPVIGCKCHVCLSSSSYNKRWRPSVLIHLDNRNFLIDVGPDFRTQALHFNIQTLDGLLLTHAHHDHTAGLDDLRPINYRRDKPLPIFLSEATAEDLTSRFEYLIEKNETFNHFNFQVFKQDRGCAVFENIPIQYMTYEQGGMKVNGYRIGALAYISDIRDFPETIYDDLYGIDTLIISALRLTPSKLHFTVDEAIDFADRLQVKQVWITHVSHELEYEQTNAYLPGYIRLAYDGLKIKF